MTWLAVLSASLVGSPHCAGMCGGFVVLCAGPAAAARQGRGILGQLAYHAGRLVAYGTLGIIAGSLGAALDHTGGHWGAMQRAAGIAMGVLLIAMAARTLGIRLPARLRLPSSDGRRWPRLSRALARLRSQTARFAMGRGSAGGFAIGLVSTLLPCMWLWSFVAVAATTLSPWQGLAIMAAFWLGTVPVLLALGLASSSLGGWAQRLKPRLTAAVMLFAGVMALTGKLAPSTSPAAHHCAPPAASSVAHDELNR